MRNNLAERVLNSDMLFLMKAYQQNICNPSSLNAVIQLLEFTSKYIDIYRSREKFLPYKTPDLTHFGKYYASSVPGTITVKT